MAKAYYLGVIERDPNGKYGISFPDLPGCVSAGDDMEGVVSGGKEALALHLDGMREDGLDIPSPSPVTAFDADEWPSEVSSLLMIPVESESEARARSVKANITMNEALLNRVDAAAQADGLTRSALLAIAARHWLRDNASPGSTAVPAERGAVRHRMAIPDRLKGTVVARGSETSVG